MNTPPSSLLRFLPALVHPGRLVASCLAVLAGAALPTAAFGQTSTSAVPGAFNFQGKVANANGTLVGAGTPVNRTVIFRIWDHTTNSTNGNLLYTEQQTVTITEGEFSVLIGQGSALTTTPLGFAESGKGPPTVKVGDAAVFGGATRYLGVTIDDSNSSTTDPEITPRQQLVTTPFAFRARYAESVGSNGVNVLTVLDSGNVGIGAANPGAKLEVAGNVRAGGAGVANPSLQLLANHASNLAASIGYANSAGTLSSDAAAIDTVFRTENGGKLLIQSGTGASALTIGANNYVGIGVGDPGGANGPWNKGRLSVDGNIVLKGEAGGGSWTNQRLLFGGDGTGYVLNIGSVTNAGAINTPVMTLSDIGRVGIGMAAPDAIFRVNAPDATADAAIFTRTGLPNGIHLHNGPNGDNYLRSGSSIGKVILQDTGGKVGIGTNAPDATLRVVAPATTTDTAMFSRTGLPNVSHVHFGANGDIYLRSGSSAGKVILQDSGGNVGIGHASPTRARLDVHGSVNLGTIYYAFYNGSSGYATGSPNFGIFSSSSIGTSSEFIVWSDARIKIVEGRSDGPADLRTLMQVEVTDYRYKDKIARRDTPQKKVLGQQLERVFPQAVMRTTDVVPDIYEMATIKDGWISLATDLKSGERIRLITDDGEELCEVSAVEPGRFRVDETPKGEKVFVYGREVKDFRTVDYDAIAMLNVSATQEIKREKDAEIAALRKELAELRAGNATIQTDNAALVRRVADLETKDRARDAKLAAIERWMQSPRPAVARPASLTTTEEQE